MKIIGLTYDNGVRLTLKGDSALLVNEKPFFIPDYVVKMHAHPCLVLRVSRLGKNIASRFASRYYDAWAPGFNLLAELNDEMCQLAIGQSAIEQSLDGSMVVGQFQSLDMIPDTDLIVPIEDAISTISRYMTIRQGDFLFVDLRESPLCVQPEDILTAPIGDPEQLFCRIK